jgi:hypothetical protein
MNPVPTTAAVNWDDGNCDDGTAKYFLVNACGSRLGGSTLSFISQ